MKVVTAVVNNPVFIEIQNATLKKYLKGEYEFIVFNDAKDFPDYTNGNDIKIKKEIEEVCKKEGIKCINIPNEGHKRNSCAATRCADSMNYILGYQKKNPDKYLLLDSDMFLIDELDINKYINYDNAVVLQSRNNNSISYIWNGIYYFDMLNMKNIELLNWNCCRGCDVGGMMQEWLKKQLGKKIPNTDEIRWTNNNYNIDKFYFLKPLSSCSWDKSELPENLKNRKKLIEFLENDIRNINGKYFCEIYDNIFLHYRAGGNWRKEGMNMHKMMSKKLKESII